MADKVKLDGVTISMGGQTFIVPALSLGQVRRLTPQIALLSDSGEAVTPDVINAAVELVTAAISRNYPDVTADQVVELIDLRNFKSVIDAIMGVSGLKAGSDTGEATGEVGR